MTASKHWLVAFAWALPWLIGAAPGSTAQLGAWLAAACVLSGLLFIQSVRAWPLSLLLAAAISLGMAGLQYAGLASQLSPWIAQASPGEMLGNLRQRNQLATLLTLGILSIFALHALHAARFENQRWLLAACAIAALLSFGNALSGSRTGLLQWMVLLAVACVWRGSHGRAWRWLIGAVALGYVVGMVCAPVLAQLLGHGNAGLLSRAEDSNAFSRLVLWRNVLELIAREPLLGHGWGSLAYTHYSSDFSGTRFMEMLDNAHNLPLHLAVELGLPIALAFCAGVAWLIWKNKPWAETRADHKLAWGVLLMMGIHSMVEYPLWYGPFFMTALVCIGILCADLWKKWGFPHGGHAQLAMNLGAKCLGGLLLAGTAFVAFDYHRASQIYLQPSERSSWYAADPLAAAKSSVLFRSQAKFAELQITPLSKSTAPRVLELSVELVQWSPEPRIIEALIESSVMMGLDDLAMFHMKRYAIAYPAAHAAWRPQQK